MSGCTSASTTAAVACSAWSAATRRPRPAAGCCWSSGCRGRGACTARRRAARSSGASWPRRCGRVDAMPLMPVVASDAHRGHDPPYEVNSGQVVRPGYERVERAEVLRAALVDAGHPIVEPAPHGLEPVLAVHEPALVEFLDGAYAAWRAAGGPEVLIPDTFALPGLVRDGGRELAGGLGRPGRFCFDTATPLVAGSYQAARAAADVALTGADLVAGGAGAAYALCRPPGHHAGPGYYGGFCLLNNAAIAATALRRLGRRRRRLPPRQRCPGRRSRRLQGLTCVETPILGTLRPSVTDLPRRVAASPDLHRFPGQRSSVHGRATSHHRVATTLATQSLASDPTGQHPLDGAPDVCSDDAPRQEWSDGF